MDLTKDTAFAHRVLDALSLRSKVAMHNIANQNTPGYKRYFVTFEEQLRKASAEGKDVGKVYPEVQRDESGRDGVNNVSVYDELSILEKVKLLHEIFTRRAGGYFSDMNKAIFGR
jgi:flagellar basal-body rod protein FlgB